MSRVGINLAIRLGCFGFITWWLVDRWGRPPGLWVLALYVFMAGALLLQPLLLLTGWIYMRFRVEDL